MKSAALLMLLGLANPIQAASSHPHPALAEKSQLAAPWTKVDRAVRESIAGGATSFGGQVNAVNPVREDASGRAHLSVYVSSLTDEQTARLKEHGLAITFQSEHFGFVEGWAALADVEKLAALDFVTSVRPVATPITNTGSVASQGDTIHRADLARATFGVTGAGVKVGVLSDSVDGMATAVSSGDLPSDVQVLQAGTGAGEGTAMLEIVHDLAPGSALAFYGPSSSGDMIDGITQLAANGASVIVDDLWFFDQPIYEEGPIAQTVNAHAARNVIYATSAVNSARKHYGLDLQHRRRRPAPPPLRARAVPPVDHGEPRLRPDHALLGGSVGTLEQRLRPVPPADRRPDHHRRGRQRAERRRPADGDDHRHQQQRSASPGALGRAALQRQRQALRRLLLGVSDIQFGSPVSSIPGHANAAGAITVAAANADNPSAIADYSSQGPCNIVFPVVETRAKPDITGIAGVAVTGAAGFSNPFFGTSAAAPHIGALAALVRQANPGLSATQVKQTLMGTAADLGAVGYDYVFGAGGADAYGAVAAAIPPPPTTTTTTLPPPPPDPCAGQVIPRPLFKKIQKATNALVSGKFRQAGKLLKQVRSLARKYTRGRRPKLSFECGASIAAAATP